MSNTAKKQAEESASMTVVKSAENVPAIVQTPQELSLEQKIHKVEDLVLLIEKHKRLKESQRNLQTFKLANDGASNYLQLRDLNNSTEFKTYNSSVIAEVLEVVKQTLAARIAEIEQQITF
jgi:hypothetical protein